MIVNPDPILALMREQRHADLALLALLAVVTGEPPERAWQLAAERCAEARTRMLELNPQRDQPRYRGHGPAWDVLAYIDRQIAWAGMPPQVSETAKRVSELAGRCEPALRQVAQRQAA